MHNEMTPEYLSSLVPPSVGSTVRYALRNESNLQTVPAMSRQYYESFLPSTTRMYNALSDEIKNSPSLEAFKARLNRNTVKPPIYYYAGSRLGQIYHTRLRLKCSSLHQHLFLKKIIANPLCECGAVEDTQHFFLNCYRFRNLRLELFNKISTFCQPTLEVILYGNVNISIDDNKQVFLAVQEYILKTRRFCQ